MKTRSLLLTLPFMFMSSSALAATITLTATAIGDPNPPLSTDLVFINGDFEIRQTGNPPPGSLINDVTEETTIWDYDLNPQLAGRELTDVTSALLTLDVKTGGDTPANDPFRMNGIEIANPFNGPASFDSFTVSLDLLDLFGEEDLLRVINSDGLVNFGLGNDSTVSRADLNIQGIVAEVPLPASAGLLLGALAVIGGARGARRRRD